jgi:hypothetical protein
MCILTGACRALASMQYCRLLQQTLRIPTAASTCLKMLSPGCLTLSALMRQQVW